MATAGLGFILGLVAGTQLREQYDFPTPDKLVEVTKLFHKESLESNIQVTIEEAEKRITESQEKDK